MFAKWFTELPIYMEGWAAHYPGRGSRHNETPINDLRSLIEKLAEYIQPLLDKPFAFFGHSMGGLAAFELTRYLRKHNLPQPTMLFISACGAPDLPTPHPYIHKLPDAEFLEAVQKFNGTPSELLQQLEVMQIILPMLRADFEAIECYHYATDELPLNVPITAFGGRDDSRVSREHLERWALHTNSNFRCQYFSGDHFFLNTARESIITSIVAGTISFHEKA